MLSVSPDWNNWHNILTAVYLKMSSPYTIHDERPMTRFTFFNRKKFNEIIYFIVSVRIDYDSYFEH